MTVPVRELLEAGQCTAPCLLARIPEADCQCICGGVFHGALIETEVSGQRDIRPWWKRCGQGGWTDWLLDQTVPIANTIAQHNHVFQTAKILGDPFLVVEKRGRTWGVVHDSITIPDDAWDQECSHAVRRFMHDLLKCRRATHAWSPPATWVGIAGISDRHEARVIAALIGEASAGNLEGISRAIAVLEGQPDPVTLGLVPSSWLLASAEQS